MRWIQPGLVSVGLCALAGAWGCSAENDGGLAAASGSPQSASTGGSIGLGAGTSSGSGSGSGGSGYVGSGSGGSASSLPSLPSDQTGSGGASGDEPREPLGTNPFVVVEHDPLSTFGADVDTASYDVFRRDVNLGALPAPSGVRLEEYVNNFSYDYPAPEQGAEHPFLVSLAASPSLFEFDTTILRIGIQGVLPPPEEKKPANLVFLVDVSGSMQGPDKLPLVKQVLTETIGILDPTDTISIVTYAGSTAVRLEPTPAADAETIKNVIESLASGGSTAGAAGIDLAYEQATAGFIDGGINHVVLCTDGDFNVGPYSTSELLDLIVEKRKSGVTLTALGFGADNLNDSMMEAVSNAGNGMYGVISSSAQASEYVQNRMLATIVHIAKDMKIQVEFNPEHVYAYRLLGYEDRAILDEDFRDDAVDAGEIGAGHRVTALYELVLAGKTIPDVQGVPELDDGASYDGAVEVAAEDLVLVKVRYKQPGASEEDPAAEVGSSLSPADIAENHRDLDGDFQWALAMASFAEILKQSPYAAPSRLPAIEEVLMNPAHGGQEDRAEFQGLFTKARPLLSSMP